MFFQIRKLVLWPRIDAKPRVVEFEPGLVNVISGASKTGKSAVIPVIDYCLCSDKCSIPVGVIRESCSWFGVVVDTVEGQKLFARREPGDQQTTGDMILLEAPQLVVPDRITGKTTNVDTVKGVLNRLASLTGLQFEPESDSGFKSRPSFRDLMAFTFQPQNIVANPDVMFFKAETTEHREKLKTIFPYVLGAVTPAILQARFELERLSRALRRKEIELREIMLATGAWQAEAHGWVRQATELGLLPADQIVPPEWLDVIGLLRSVAARHADSARPSLKGIEATLTHLERLRDQEILLAKTLSEHRQRLMELRRLRESSDAYGSALHVQRDRLAISSWLQQVAKEEAGDTVVKIGKAERSQLANLCENLEAIELKLRTHPAVSETLDRETLRQRVATEEVLVELNAVRSEMARLERDSDEARDEINHFEKTERFLGRLEQAIKLYDQTDSSSALRDEIVGLKTEIEKLHAVISAKEVKRKLQNALDRVEKTASEFVPQLDAEWPDALIKLIVEDLTVKVVRGTRDDYLWEIGSGANWLAYHVAMSLALQKFFLTEPHHPVPGLLVYDQPSQVYFPKRLAAASERSDALEWRDQDVVAVRKIFALLGKEALRSKGRLQIIILDHAGEDVWDELDGVRITEEWRGGTALVPQQWIAPNAK